MRRAAIGAVALVALVAVALGSSGCSREPVVDAVRTTTTSDRPSAAAFEVIEALDAAADACGLLAVIDGGTPDDSLPAVYDAFAAAITRIAPSVDDDLSADWDDLGRTIRETRAALPDARSVLARPEVASLDARLDQWESLHCPPAQS